MQNEKEARPALIEQARERLEKAKEDSLNGIAAFVVAHPIITAIVAIAAMQFVIALLRGH